MNYIDSSTLSEAERERLADAIRAGRRVRLREAPAPPNVACCYFCEGTFDPSTVVEHVRGCERHPLRTVLDERDAAVARAKRAEEMPAPDRDDAYRAIAALTSAWEWPRPLSFDNVHDIASDAVSPREAAIEIVVDGLRADASWLRLDIESCTSPVSRTVDMLTALLAAVPAWEMVRALAHEQRPE